MKRNPPSPAEILAFVRKHSIVPNCDLGAIMQVMRAIEMEGLVERIKPIGGVSPVEGISSDEDEPGPSKRRKMKKGDDSDSDDSGEERKAREKAKMKKKKEKERERAKEKEREKKRKEKEREEKEREKKKRKRDVSLRLLSSINRGADPWT
jgi:DNA-directed RNA polymerase III subunit RPC6